VRDDLDDEIPRFDTEPAASSDLTAEDAAFNRIQAAGLQWRGPKWLGENGIVAETVEPLVASGRLIRHPIIKGNVGLPELLAGENGDSAAPPSLQKPPTGDRSKNWRGEYGKGGSDETPDGERPTS
jgi:hypothetical protein